METRTRHPKLLALHQPALDCEPSAAPMTPVASLAADSAAAFSPRDPSAKLAASLKLAGPARESQAQRGLQLPSPSAASEDEDEEDEDEPPSGGARGLKPNTGRWTEAEHQLFLQGLEAFPYRAWKKIATLIKTRTVVQIRTHAQKYYQKLEKEEARLKEREREAQAQAQVPLSTPGASVAGVPHPHQLALAHVALHQHQHQHLSAPSTPVASGAADAADSPRRRSMLRKRKCAPLPLQLDGELSDDAGAPLPSLPKRMMREKKFARESHMSPKQKAPGAAAAKFFGDLDAQPHNRLAALAAASRGPLGAVLLTPSKAAGGAHPLLSFPVHGLLQPPHAGHLAQAHAPLPLDFGDASADAMLLDLADERAAADFPFPLDAAGLDQGMSSIDNDDLLQLTEEELDWFSTDGSSASASSAESSPRAEEDEAPFALGRFQFPALVDDDECLRFGDDLDMAGPLISAPSPMLAGDAGAALDDDFVLDPEKFLSSYLGPAEASQC